MNLENKMMQKEVAQKLQESNERTKEMLEAIKIFKKMMKTNKNKTVKAAADSKILDLEDEVSEEKEYQKELSKALKKLNKNKVRK